MGAAMSGPDYAWWHGMYDVSKNFYTEFLPEVKEIAGPAVYDELVKKYLASDPAPRVVHEGDEQGAAGKDKDVLPEALRREVAVGQGGKRPLIHLAGKKARAELPSQAFFPRVSLFQTAL